MTALKPTTALETKGPGPRTGVQVRQYTRAGTAVSGLRCRWPYRRGWLRRGPEVTLNIPNP